MTNEHFNPIPLDTKAELARAMQRPGFKAAWDGLEEEYAALNALLDAHTNWTEPVLVTQVTRHAARLRPATVAVHDDRNVPRELHVSCP